MKNRQQSIVNLTGNVQCARNPRGNRPDFEISRWNTRIIYRWSGNIIYYNGSLFDLRPSKVQLKRLLLYTAILYTKATHSQRRKRWDHLCTYTYIRKGVNSRATCSALYRCPSDGGCFLCPSTCNGMVSAALGRSQRTAENGDAAAVAAAAVQSDGENIYIDFRRVYVVVIVAVHYEGFLSQGLRRGWGNVNESRELCTLQRWTRTVVNRQ